MNRGRGWRWQAALGAGGALVFVVGLMAGRYWFPSEAHPGAQDDPHGGGEHGAHAERAQEYTCSMHPQIRSKEPGLCPICGMDLIPVGDDDAGTGGAANRISLSPRARTLAKIRTAVVERRAAQGEQLRLLGRVDYDETRLRTVTTWTKGRLDKLHVAVTGARIQAGQAIATLYSPEVYASHQDLLQAAKQVVALKNATPTAQDAARGVLDAARTRLRLLGVPENEVAVMEQADSPWEQVPIRSPFSGTVIERLLDEGRYVQAGTGIYRLADLSRVWLQLDAYESDLPRVQVGLPVELTTDALPGQLFEGQVAFIDPVLDARTRTARVRVEVGNKAGQLRPGMFAEAVIRGTAAGHAHDPLTIPASAPLFSGRRSLVYVEIAGGTADTVAAYEAREVRLGPKTGAYYPVVTGLREGERVVVNGAFVLDADLQIRGGVSLMSMGDDLTRPAQQEPVSVSPATARRLAPLLERYLAVQRALASDDLAAATTAAQGLAAAAASPIRGESSAFTRVFDPLRAQLVTASKELSAATDVASARRIFEPLSKAQIAIVERFGNPTAGPIRLTFCPMAIDNRGALWLQTETEVSNPYHGAAMLRCGEIYGSAASGEHLDASMRGGATDAAGQGDAHQH